MQSRQELVRELASALVALSAAERRVDFAVSSTNTTWATFAVIVAISLATPAISTFVTVAGFGCCFVSLGTCALMWVKAHRRVERTQRLIQDAEVQLAMLDRMEADIAHREMLEALGRRPVIGLRLRRS